MGRTNTAAYSLARIFHHVLSREYETGLEKGEVGAHLKNTPGQDKM